MIHRDEATERQVQAARPDASTWLAANAGSGKTRVLTDRVARLLLDGVEPQRILCLTYTKAAASEMQNRLFSRLGEWAMLEDSRLRTALENLGVDGTLTRERMRDARTLFARAIEAPGGLKIQTIHSFCAALLRRFPLEAGVSPQFTEVEDRAAALLRADIIDDFAAGPQAGLIEAAARYMTDADFDKLTSALAGARDSFAQMLDETALMDLFGLPADADDALPVRIAFDGLDAGMLREASALIRPLTKTMVELADVLDSLNLDSPGWDDLRRLYGAFLYAANDGGHRAEAKFDSIPTTKARKALGPLCAQFDALMDKVAAARDCELSLAAVRRTRALHDLARAFLPEYERRKQMRGWLDFDDLIGKARQLLNDPAVAAWVLFRLDGGIDHILVDEAQDTSPAQWDVIEKLAQEFTAGRGAREGAQRTIFVVGDKKQSIYSFQGADPDAFDRMQSEFATKLRDSETELQDLTLDHSFRSAAVILDLVDRVFAGRAEAGFPGNGRHVAFKSDLPGRVDLWPLVEDSKDKDDRHWSDPVDRPGARNPAVILARRIARTIREMVESGETIPDDSLVPGQIHRRPVRPGDFLILVQRRSDLFAELIRACKDEGLPIAGADRLKVGAELAVRDLAALLSFLDTPEDSLSLATMLRSPLFGWSEQALFDLAHRREERHLWQALRKRSSEFSDTMAMIEDLRDRADFLRPFDLIERILTRHDGRRKFLARLGPEAEDGINALLSQALAYERTEVPSLTGFLLWMETDDLTVKRQQASAGDMVRVMTVHGAKGLEAPIVILPDTADRKPPSDATILMTDGVPVWKVNAADTPSALAAAREASRQREANERLRLLYVAMTRAEKWLIVAAAGKAAPDGESWYRAVETAMIQAQAPAVTGPHGTGLRLSDPNWTAPETFEPDARVALQQPLPAFLAEPAPATGIGHATLSPSDLGGAKALPGDAGEDEETAKQRGTWIHLLLERLPGLDENRWSNAATALLPGIDPTARKSVLDEATAVLRAPSLAPIFAPGVLAEVAISARLGARRLHGVIDRLIVAPNRVTAVDFKSNAVVPGRPEDCPEGLLRQMGAYALGLAQIYPDRDITVALVWTRTAEMMELPHDVVTQSVARSLHLDADQARS